MPRCSKRRRRRLSLLEKGRIDARRTLPTSRFYDVQEPELKLASNRFDRHFKMLAAFLATAAAQAATAAALTAFSLRPGLGNLARVWMLTGW